MITLRKAADRGHFDFGWLDTSHTFSFGEYHDPAHMGFRSLRVINDDLIGPGQGFPTHSHRDMEILSWIAEGALEHKDSLGTGSVIRPGDLQRMSAGTGVRHSEFNPSPQERTRLLQIWILPRRSGLAPGYEQKQFPLEARTNRLALIAAENGRDGSVTVHQDLDLWTARLDAGKSVAHAFAPGRHGWVQVVSGAIDVGSRALSRGDGAALSDERAVLLRAETPAEILLFDLA